jgi:hypothetical protein
MSNLERVTVGLAAAALVPTFVPWVGRRRATAAAAAAVLSAWTLYPLGVRYAEWVVAGAACAIQAALAGGGDADRLPRRVGRGAGAALLAGLLALVAAFTFDAGATWAGLRHTLESGEALGITCGLLLALFPSGALIGRLTEQWSVALERDLEDEVSPQGLAGAGRAIGWLERAAIYFALILGRPEAVAVVFTAKSIARFPSFKREAFAEYYLIGTLLSVVAGAGSAVAIRLLLGWSAV